MKIQGIQGEFCEIPLVKICVKSPRFGTNENVEITVGVLDNLRLADLLLGNDLFQANSKLRDPIEIVNFDVSPSPVMDKATTDDQIVESVVTFVNSEIVVPSSDPIEISAVLGHSLNLMLMTEIMVQSRYQMRRSECSEAWI